MLSQKDYRRWLTELEHGRHCLDYYGNWAVPPWVIEKEGAENVERELKQRFGGSYHLRKSEYQEIGTTGGLTVYILERET